MKRALFLLALVSIAGCGPNRGGLGVFIGRVTDAMTGAPLAGVKVHIMSDIELKAETDADGYYKIEPVPLGDHQAWYQLDGYLKSRCNVYFSTDGLNDRNLYEYCDVRLAQGLESLKGVLLTNTGKAAANVKVVADLRSAHDLQLETTTDSNGGFTFTGLPSVLTGFTFTLIFNGFDENNDGTVDYLPTTSNVTIRPGQSGISYFTLNNDPQRLVTNNLANGSLEPTENISITFGVPVNSTLSSVRLRNNTTAIDWNVKPTWEQGLKLTVMVPQIATAIGESFTLTLTLVNQNGTTSTYNLNFVVRRAADTAITAPVTDLTLLSPLPTALESTSRNYTLSFKGVDGAAGYRVFARDTTLFPQWQLVATSTGEGKESVEVSFTLPTRFDAYAFDGVISPLANGNQLTFTVVPFDTYNNESPISDGQPSITVRDMMRPTPTSLGAQSGDGSNESGAMEEVTIPVSYSDLMDTSINPTLLTQGSVMPTWTWDADKRGGYFTFKVPPNGSVAGPFTVRGGKDSSGNAVTLEMSGVITGFRDLLTNGDFETSGCTLGSWTGSTDGAGSMPSAQVATVRNGACAAALGDMPGAAPTTGKSRLVQAINLPTLATGEYFSVSGYYRVYSDLQAGASGVLVRCGVWDAAGTTLLVSLVSTTGAFSSSNFLQFNTTVPSIYAGSSVNVGCEVDNQTVTARAIGLVVDDLKLGIPLN